MPTPTPTQPPLKELILKELHAHNRGVDRAEIELIAVHHGYEPHLLTKELQRLVACGAVRPPNCISGGSGSRPTYVYSACSLREDQLAWWQDRIAQREALLPAHEQGLLLEHFARALIGRGRRKGADWFRVLPHKRRLGNFAIAANRKADLIVSYELPGAHFSKIILEAKNRREHIDVSSDVLPTLMESAREARALPVLCAAHVTPRALALCDNVGIAVLHLGRRLASTSKRARVRKLWPMASREFHFVNEGRPLRAVDGDLPGRLIEKVKNPRWLLDADRCWNANEYFLTWAISELRNGHWNDVARCFSNAAVRSTALRAA